MKKPVKISTNQLRKLISEAIQHRPAGTPEPMGEAWGAWDARGIPGQEPEMADWNFEQTHKELFANALDPVIEEFKRAIKETYSSDRSWSDDEAALDSELSEIAHALREDLLEIIGQKCENALEALL